MSVRMSVRIGSCACLIGLLSCVAAGAESPAVRSSAERKTTAKGSSAQPVDVSGKRDAAEGEKTVEMFAAMKSGDIDVKLIARDSRGGNVLITNKTKKPLKIALPEAFAAVPVNAQFGGMGGMGGMGGGGMGMGGMGGGGMGGGGMQGMGGGMGGMGGGGMGGMGGMGGGGMGGGGGFFNVGPEKVGKIKVATVCLEHGKKEPNQRVPYTLVPFDSFSDKSDVKQLCRALGRGEIPQNAAQAAVWHAANGLSWDELAAKVRVKHLDGSTEMYFSADEVAYAARIAAESTRRAAAEPASNKSASPGEQAKRAGK